MIRLLVTRLKCHPPIEGSKKGPHKAVASYLPSSARTMRARSGDRDGGVRSWRRGWRAGCALALWLGAGVENHSFVVTDHKFIAPLRCSECGGNAHLIRRSPHAVKSLEIRIFECHECRCQTQRIVTGEGRVP